MIQKVVFPAELFRSGEFAIASKDAFSMYCVLRGDAMECVSITSQNGRDKKQLLSGLDLKSLAQRTGVPQLSVIRLGEELHKREWIFLVRKNPNEIIYHLGNIVDLELNWFLDEKVKKLIEATKPVDKNDITVMMKNALAESRARLEAKKEVTKLPTAIKERLASTVSSEIRVSNVTSKDILMNFRSLYRTKYGSDAPLVSDAKGMGEYAATYMYIGRAVKWSANNPDKVLKVIRFLFESNNWERILRVCSWITGPLSFHLIGSSKVWPQLEKFYVDGIPEPSVKSVDDITKRYDAKKSEDSIGW